MGDTLRGVNVAAASIAILVADTSVILEGAILGKPESPTDAEPMIPRLPGRAQALLPRCAVRGRGSARGIRAAARATADELPARGQRLSLGRRRAA